MFIMFIIDINNIYSVQDTALAISSQIKTRIISPMRSTKLRR